MAHEHAHHDSEHAHHGSEHEHGDASEDSLAELLDLDGEVLHEYWSDALSTVLSEATDTGPARIVDLGAGTGVATIAFAQLRPDAALIAVDSSVDMLSRIRAKASDLGLADRIHTVKADLDAEWPTFEPVDLTWASMSLHHLADPDRVLSDVLATTRPGGLIAVAEMAEPVRFLPDDLGLGRPGLEARCLEALSEEHAHTLPELGAEWAPRLAAAGFTVLSERTLSIDLRPPHPPAATRYARRWLQRLGSGVSQRLDPEDQHVLSVLIDSDAPESLQHRDDLQIRGVRTLTLARRP